MDWSTILGAVGDVLKVTYVQIALTVAAVLIVQLILRISIGHIVQRAIRSHKYKNKSDEEKREKTLITIFRTASAVTLWTIALIVILWQLDVNIAALMTGAGLIGIVVGFGAQSAIKDFLAGIFIIAENQYRVGDIVILNAAGQNISGVVEDITVRITRLRDLDGNLHIVQNGSTDIVSNLSFKFANVNVDVRVAYDANIDQVEKIINQVGRDIAKAEEWAKHVIEPIEFLRVDGFEDYGVRVKALGKVEAAKQWSIAADFRRRLLKAFAKNNITIPLPQIVVNQPAKTAR